MSSHDFPPSSIMHNLCSVISIPNRSLNMVCKVSVIGEIPRYWLTVGNFHTVTSAGGIWLGKILGAMITHDQEPMRVSDTKMQQIYCWNMWYKSGPNRKVSDYVWWLMWIKNPGTTKNFFIKFQPVSSEAAWLTIALHRGSDLGLTNQFLPFHFISHFSKLSTQWLPIEYHIHIWYMLPELRCCNTCQIWI